MKHTRTSSTRKDSSLQGLAKISLIGFIILLVTFMLYKKDTDTEENTQVNDQTSLCSLDFFPVCGKDGKTYTNSCTAEKIADVRVAYAGECRGTEEEVVVPITPTESIIETDDTLTEWAIESLSPEENINTIEVPPSENSENISVTPEITVETIEIDPTLITYFNDTYKYGFSMPKNSYYQAFGAQNEANHSVGVNIRTEVNSLSGSDVRVYFYANTIMGDLSEIEQESYIDSTTGTVYLLLNKKDSLLIESSDPQNILVQTILKTAHKE